MLLRVTQLDKQACSEVWRHIWFPRESVPKAVRGFIGRFHWACRWAKLSLWNEACDRSINSSVPQICSQLIGRSMIIQMRSSAITFAAIYIHVRESALTFQMLSSSCQTLEQKWEFRQIWAQPLSCAPQIQFAAHIYIKGLFRRDMQLSGFLFYAYQKQYQLRS